MRQSTRKAAHEGSKEERRPCSDEMRSRIDTLEQELATALARETATAEVLGVINSSPGDLAPVFAAILEKAHALCGARYGSLQTYDGEFFRTVASRGLSDAMLELAREPFRPDPNSFEERLVRGDDLVHIPDVALLGPLPDDPLSRTAVETAGLRTLLLLPLRKEAALVGYVASGRSEVRPFTDKQIALLQNFAAQAVIAMENARLLTETRQALEQQTATAEVLGVINSSPGDLAPVFDAMLEKAHSLCGIAAGGLVLFDGELFRAVATRGYGENVVEVLRQPFRGNAFHQQLVRGQRFVHIPDMLAAPELNDTVGLAAQASGFRTNLLVPLRKDGRLLGHISASRKEVRPFSEKEIALLENFAAQAVIAMENARFISETREALEQQTATAEVLGVINSSPGDLAPVFDAMLEKAMRLCEAAHGHVWLYDGERAHPAAVRGEPRLVEWMRRVGSVEPERSGRLSPLGRVVRGEPLVHVADAREDEAYRSSPVYRELVDVGGIRTILDIALRKGDALVGVVALYRQELRPFSDKQIALLQNFAAQAVIAMENARLLGELHHRTEEVAELNRGLEARVAEQVEELGRVGRLKRFLAPQLAELIVSQGDEKILESHRREIVVVFCDLRGYTAFTETAEPEEVLDFLREYHGALGPLISHFEGTLDQFSGDGIMVFFNDPVPIPDPAERAVKMAVAMRDAAGSLITVWRRRDRELGFGAGIAQGYATLGQIGFAERSGYTAIGTVCNLAARLCAEAKDGQILISGRVAAAVEKAVPLEDLGSLTLRGLSQPVSAFNVPLSASHPVLRVIEGGPPGI